MTGETGAGTEFMPMLKRCTLALLALAVAHTASPAQDFPSRPVTIVVPLTAAGAPDVLARVIAQHLQTRLGQSFTVENRAGGGTTIGSNAVAKSPPDGYTLLIATSSSLAINVTLQKALPYDPVTDFVPLAAVAQSPFLLLANPSIPAKSVTELIAFGKANPDKLSFASAGIGTPHDLFAEMFMNMTGIKVPQVRYKGSLPAINDVIGGHVPIMFCDVPSAAGALRGGTVSALGVTTKARLPGFPDIPPISDSLPGFEGAAWLMIAAPAKTPEPVVQKLHSELNAILTLPEVSGQMAKMNVIPMGTPSVSEMRDFIKAEITRWGDVVKKAGIAQSQE
jgi:tripartite-type tricarboxylate transporter receptor subunit TctC